MVVLFDSEPSESHRSTIKQNRKVSGVESLFLDEAPVKNFGVVAEPGLLYRPGKAKGHASGLVGSNPTDTSRSIMALAMSSGLDRLGRKY